MQTLRIPAIADALPDVSRFLDGLGKRAQITEKDAFRLRLAVDELIMNISRHANFGDQAPEIELYASSGYYRVLIQIVDTAQEFDPSTQPQDEYALRFVRFCADRIIYERVGALNRTIIVVRRSDRRLTDAVVMSKTRMSACSLDGWEMALQGMTREETSWLSSIYATVFPRAGTGNLRMRTLGRPNT